MAKKLYTKEEEWLKYAEKQSAKSGIRYKKNIIQDSNERT